MPYLNSRLWGVGADLDGACTCSKGYIPLLLGTAASRVLVHVLLKTDDLYFFNFV